MVSVKDSAVWGGSTEGSKEQGDSGNASTTLLDERPAGDIMYLYRVPSCEGHE